MEYFSLQSKGQKTVNRKHLPAAKHPSIWQKGWKNRPNGFGLQQTTLSQSQPLPARPRCKVPSPFVESDVDDEAAAMEEAEINEDLLMEYSKERDPPPKKFKADAEDFGETNETDTHALECTSPPPRASTSSRNPFKKESAVSDVLNSPTRITSANSSLIKNQSPVKAIDFKRLSKLSKFNRTETTNKQNVISRFFKEPQEKATNSAEKGIAVAEVLATEEDVMEKNCEQLNELLSNGDCKLTATLLYSNISGDSAVSLDVENGTPSIQETANESGENDDIVQKTDFICDSNDGIIVLSETDESGEESAPSQPKDEPKKVHLQNGVVSIYFRALKSNESGVGIQGGWHSWKCSSDSHRFSAVWIGQSTSRQILLLSRI